MVFLVIMICGEFNLKMLRSSFGFPRIQAFLNKCAIGILVTLNASGVGDFTLSKHLPLAIKALSDRNRLVFGGLDSFVFSNLDQLQVYDRTTSGGELLSTSSCS